MKGKQQLICLLTFLAFTIGCTRDDEFVPQYQVPEKYQPLIDLFITEAAAHGVTLDVNNLILKEDTLPSQRCGSCNSNSLKKNIQKLIIIREDPCWLNGAEEEALIFH